MTPKQETQRKAAFSTAYQDYEKGLNRRAFFKVHDHGISDGLVQDTFVKTWTYLVAKGEIATMKAFLYHVLNNLIVDEYRRRKTTSLDVLVEGGHEPNTGNSDRLFNGLDGKAALLLIARLPQTYQQVMNMRYVRNLSIKEISLITGKSKNLVTVQAYRGLEKLKLLYNLE